MLIVSYGMIKSASTFVYNALDNVLETQCAAVDRPYVRLSSITSQSRSGFIDGTADLALLTEEIRSSFDVQPPASHLLVKTHLPYQRLQPLLDNFDWCCVATYRHPADLALSLVDAAKKDRANGAGRFDDFITLDAAMAQIAYQRDCFLSWYHRKGTVSIYFDSIASNALATLERAFSELNLGGISSESLTRTIENRVAIPEYNKGVMGRRHDELSVDMIRRIEGEHPELMKVINLVPESHESS